MKPPAKRRELECALALPQSIEGDREELRAQRREVRQDAPVGVGGSGVQAGEVHVSRAWEGAERRRCAARTRAELACRVRLQGARRGVRQKREEIPLPQRGRLDERPGRMQKAQLDLRLRGAGKGLEPVLAVRHL